MSNDAHNNMGNSQPRMYVDNVARVDNAWPKALTASSKAVHLHLIELLDAWMIHPEHSGDTAHINYALETQGRTVFRFTNWFDLNEFVVFFQLHDFMLNRQAKVRPTGELVYQPFALELNNSFTHAAAYTFLSQLNLANDRLMSIHQERVRAASFDAGRVGYLSVDHFNVRERIQLRNIDMARMALGRSNQTPLHYIPTQKNEKEK